jgi:copper transport protein
MTTMQRLLARAALVVLAGVLAVLGVPGRAVAHAYLAGSSPADGAILDRAPDLLTLRLTEHVELPATRVEIVDGDGRRWATTSLALRASEGADGDTESPVEIVVGLPALPANTYHISWRTLSSDDLHATKGTLVFGVQRPVAAAAAIPGPAGPGPRESALRALGLLGLAMALGGVALAFILGRVGRPADPVLGGRLLRVAALGGALALVTTPALLLVQVSAGRAGIGRLFVQQATSGRWLMREIGLAALLAAALWARRAAAGGSGTASENGASGEAEDWRRNGPGIVALGVVGAALTAAGTALLGHPAGGALRTVLVGAPHVLAASAWAGGVLAAALALVPALRRKPERAAHSRLVLRAFAVLAVACVGVLTLTGLLLADAQVSTVDALLTTPYGLLLLAKVAAVAAAGMLGLRTALRLRRPAPGLPVRGLLIEAILLSGALILAGTLAAAGPARGAKFPVSAAVATVPEVTGQAADLVDTVTVRPNRPGRNVVTIAVSDTRRPAPGPLTGVSLQLTGPDGTRTVHPVTRSADGWTVTVDDIRTAGDWRVTVTVMREGLPPVTAAHRWPVAPAQIRPETVVVSSAPLRPFLNGLIGILVSTGLVALFLFAVLRRRRRPGSGPALHVADVITTIRPSPGRYRSSDPVNGVPVGLVRHSDDPDTHA